jgi:phenylacetate-coenzyme A ligase PaaK-like adenylate-forming protein
MRARSIAPEIRRQVEGYEALGDQRRARDEQLRLLNVEWSRVVANSPYYGQLMRDRGLPREFRSLEEFVERMPRTTRDVIQDNHERMRCGPREPDHVLMTGGTTSKPIQLPAWKSETEFKRADQWLCRQWFGVTPSSRLFLIWGHAHLMGSGARGWLNAWKRKLADGLLGYYRFSAYDLRSEKMEKAARALVRFRPDYVVGYSVALDRFAQANEDRRRDLRDVGLRVVIGTAEAFPSPRTEQRLRELFGCAVAMEYGAVETGVIAHTHPEGGYRALWLTHLLEAEPASGGRHTLLLTSLRPRCFPLLRYEIGDEVRLQDPSAGHGIGLQGFEAVVGRCNEYVPMPDGARIHSEVFTHAVRSCEAVRSYQVVHGSGSVRILFTSAAPLGETDSGGILRRLSSVHPELADTTLERVGELRRSVAGKTPMVIQEAGRP